MMLLIFTWRHHHRHYRPKRVNNRIKYKRKNNLSNIFFAYMASSNVHSKGLQRISESKVMPICCSQSVYIERKQRFGSPKSRFMNAFVRTKIIQKVGIIQA